jgi:hypothetical protein
MGENHVSILVYIVDVRLPSICIVMSMGAYAP